jgi:hypothetical protein
MLDEVSQPWLVAPDAAQTGYERIKALKKELHRNITDLLALAPGNDPFYAGSPAQTDQAQWFLALWRHFGFTRGVHLRRIHYRIVSVEGERYKKADGLPYENTEACWDYLSAAGKYARYLGLVDADAFEDHRNPAPHVYMAPREAHQPIGAEVGWLFEWRLPFIRSDLRAMLSFPIPDVGEIHGYDYHAADQPYLVEVWVEKSTQNDILMPICNRYAVNLVTSIGFQSMTGAINHLKRVRDLGKPSRIFYISDFDPAGDGMPVGVARQLEFWLQQYAPAADIKLQPLALTHTQVTGYALPRIPIKESDKGKRGFEERYGEDAVELDALQALRPGTLAALVREAIKPYRDDTLEHRLSEAHAEAREVAKQAWAEQTSEVQAELSQMRAEIEAIVSRYQERLEALDVELQAELEPFRARIETLRLAITEMAEAFAPALPDRPTPAITEVDESNWLFDSARDYLEQMAVYNARKSGE